MYAEIWLIKTLLLTTFMRCLIVHVIHEQKGADSYQIVLTGAV